METVDNMINEATGIMQEAIQLSKKIPVGPYSNIGDQLRDMIKVGELAALSLRLRETAADLKVHKKRIFPDTV